MKYAISFIACTLVIGGGLIVINWPGTEKHFVAIESILRADAKPPAKNEAAAPGTFGRHGNRQYPTFFVDEVIARLTSAAEVLIRDHKVKSSKDLQKQLDINTTQVILPASNSKELTTQELYERASESVFILAGLSQPTEKDPEWKTSFSTAFVVHDDGILSTSAHVFDHEDFDDAVVAMDLRGNVYPVIEVLAADRKSDTSLFRIEAKGLLPLPLGQDAAPGSSVRVLGHPGDSFFFFSAGHLANYEREENGNSWLNVTADFGQGSSGGPVMDIAGNVIGQVSRTSTLFAGEQSASATRRRRSTRKLNEVEVKNAGQAAPEGEKNAEPKSNGDTQMVFKACTPVSAIRALIK